jgi:hypothetical protein
MRILGNFLVPPFPGFLEVVLALLPNLAVQVLTNNLPNLTLSPIPLLIPRSADQRDIPCQKRFLQFDAVRVGIIRASGIGIGFAVSDAVPRQPNVSIQAISGNPIRVQISRLNNMRIPVATGRYQLQNLQDLRGDPSRWQVTWSAPRAVPVPPQGSSFIEMYFNLRLDGPFRVDQRIIRTVQVRGCLETKPL